MIVRCCIAALLLTPLAAHAQGNPGPFGGLFGRAPERIGRDFTALDFRTSVAGQFEDAVFLDADIADDRVPRSGATSGGQADLAFARQNDRLTFQTSGAATYQEFYQSPTFGATTYMGSALVRGRLTTRVEVGAQARYLRSPFFRLMPGGVGQGPVVVAPGDPEAVLLLDNDSYDVGGEFLSQLTKRSRFRAAASKRHMSWQGDEAGAFESVRADAYWERRLNRSFTFHAGYGNERIVQTLQPEAEYIHEIIDLGIDFAKQLSLDSRSAIAITTQTSMVRRPSAGREYRLNGTVTLSRLFRRTGQVSVSLKRATQFLPGFVAPLNSDSVTGALTGMPSKRTEWITNVSAGRGSFVDADDPFVIAQVTNRLNYAVSRRIGVFAQYAVYYHTLPATQTQFALFGNVSRQAVTLGINTWVPLINRMKVPRDPE